MLRALGCLFVLVVLVTGTGLVLGWFEVTTSEAGGQRQLTVGVDEEEIGRDAAAARERLGRLSRRVAEELRRLAERFGDDGTLRGKLVEVGPDGRLVIETETGERVDLVLPDTVPVELDGVASEADALRPGDRVRVELASGDDPRIVRVAAERE